MPETEQLYGCELAHFAAQVEERFLPMSSWLTMRQGLAPTAPSAATLPLTMIRAVLTSTVGMADQLAG